MTLARVLLVPLLALALAGSAIGQVIELKKFELQPRAEDYVVNADFNFELTPRLEQALNSGVALYFAFEFELIRPRWYWFDEKAATARIDVRLSYIPLLRQYRVSNGALHRNFSALSDAVISFSTLRNWSVASQERLDSGKSYVASLRMRLDTSQLPKPFQLSAITDREWTLSSDWHRVGLTPSSADAAQK